MLRLGNQIVTLNGSIAADPTEIPAEWSGWSGLTSYWRFDETSGSSAADAVGSVDGTLSAGSFDASGKHDYCYYNSAGAAKGVNLGNNYGFESNEAFSWSTWVKRDSINNWNYIVCKTMTTNATTGIEMKFNNFTSTYVRNSPMFFLINCYWAADCGSLRFNGVVSDIACDNTGVWYHIVYTYDGNSGSTSGMNIYVDGVKSTCAVYGASLSGSIINTNPICIGGADNSAQALIGRVDEVGVWNRELTQTEVTALYNSGTGLFY